MNTKSLPNPNTWHPGLIYESDLRLGDYSYFSTIQSWSQQRIDADGRTFLLLGRGRRPSDEQVVMWFEVDARLSELTRAAVAAAGVLLIGRRADAFTPEELVLREVRFEADGTIRLFFNYPRGEELWMWPMVTFTDWTTCRARWIV